VDHNDALDYGSGTKRVVMPEQNVIAAQNLKRLDQVYHSKSMTKTQTHPDFFNATFLCFPLN
jgi:hypothetical protein